MRLFRTQEQAGSWNKIHLEDLLLTINSKIALLLIVLLLLHVYTVSDCALEIHANFSMRAKIQ